MAPSTYEGHIRPGDPDWEDGWTVIIGTRNLNLPKKPTDSSNESSSVTEPSIAPQIPDTGEKPVRRRKKR